MVPSSRCCRLLGYLVLLVSLAGGSTAWGQTADPPEAPPPMSEDDVQKMLSLVPVGETDVVPGLQVFTREKFEAGNIAWVLAGAVACLLLMVPGLLVFYGGLLRPRELPSIGTQYLMLVAVMSVVWVLWGYSLAFARNSKSLDTRPAEIEAPDRDDLPGNLYIGGFEHVGLSGIESQMGTTAPRFPLRRPLDAIPHILFVMYQLAFYLVAPVPLVVALASRLRQGGLILFTILWSTLVYAPITYWLWGGGWQTSALDAAGGITAHVAIGFTALAIGLALAPRNATSAKPLSDPRLAALGTVLFWVGCLIWSGTRNLAANGNGASAFLVTHLAACTGLLGWAAAEWLMRGKASTLALAAGPLAGLIAIAAGSSFVAPQSAMVIGLLGGVASFAAYQLVQRRAESAPVWSVFALHAIPGALGALLAAVFATSSVGGFMSDGSPIVGLLGGNAVPLVRQLIAVASAAALAVLGGLATLLIVRITGGLLPATEARLASELPRPKETPQPLEHATS